MLGPAGEVLRLPPAVNRELERRLDATLRDPAIHRRVAGPLLPSNRRQQIDEQQCDRERAEELLPALQLRDAERNPHRERGVHDDRETARRAQAPVNEQTPEEEREEKGIHPERRDEAGDEPHRREPLLEREPRLRDPP